MKMSGDGDHARRQDECLQTGTSAPLKPAIGVQDTHVEEVPVFNKFFSRLSIHASAAKTQPNKVGRWCQNGDFLRPVFSASSVQRISDMQSKFALIRPRHVWKYPISDR